MAQGSTFTPRNRIRSEGHRNWIRCNLGLQEIGDAIRYHVDVTFKGCWNEWNHCCCKDRNCGRTSPHCHRNCQGFNHILRQWYNHGEAAHPNGWCYHIRRDRYQGEWEMVTKPHCNECEWEFDRLKSLFIDPYSEKIYWENVKFPVWKKGHWELAKAFMPRSSSHIDTPEQAETIALLTIMNNCTLFDSGEFDHGLVDKLIVMRNTLTHSASHDITNAKTIDFFVLMLKCLEMLSSVCKFSCEKKLKDLRELQNRELTGELINKAYSAIIQELMNSISDQIASGDDPSNLIERLKAAVAMQEQYNTEADNEKEIEKLKKEIVEGKEREIALETLVKEKDDIIETKNTKIKQLETETKRLQELKDREVKELTEKINELELRISDLSKDLDSKTHELKELRRKAEDLSKENQDIKEQLLLKDDSIKRLEEENQKIKLQLEIQKAEEKKLREYVKEIESRNETLNEAIHFLTDENKMLEKIKIELEQRVKELEQRMMKLSTEKNELERTIDDLKSKIACKQEEIKVLHDEINQLKISNDERNNEIRHISDILMIGSIVTVMVTVFLLRIGMILY